MPYKDLLKVHQETLVQAVQLQDEITRLENELLFEKRLRQHYTELWKSHLPADWRGIMVGKEGNRHPYNPTRDSGSY